MDAGKTLFARSGYDQTSTAAVAREAGTSESQLVRYYRGKAGLLEAIFNESWLPLNQRIQTVIAGAANAKEAILLVVETVIQAFSADHDLAFLLLIEGRRIRSGTFEIILSKGFTDFEELLRLLIRRGKRDGTFPDAFGDNALAYALMGAAEGLVRERLIAQRSGRPDPFTDEEIRKVFEALVHGLSSPSVVQGPAS